MGSDGLLTFRNVRCIPSVHNRALYAAEAERAILDWRPGVVAVEILALAEPPFLEAVRALPRIQAVCLEPDGEAETKEPVRILSMMAMDPADSIVAASRRALASGIPVACIDAWAPDEDSPSSGPAMADEELMVCLGLEAYYALYLERNAPADPPTASSLRRERAMARSLLDLSQRHERVLCVTGMYHWERIKRFMAAPPSEEDAAADPSGQAPRAYRVEVHADALPVVLGQLPYLSRTYDRFSRRGLWDRACGQAAMSDLLVEAHRRAGQAASPGRLARVAALVCRVAEAQRRLTPRVSDLLLAARGLGGRELARHLMHTACAYPQPAPTEGLAVVVCVKGYEGPLVRVDGRICVPTPADQLQASDQAIEDLVREIGAAEDFRSTERRSYVEFITCRDENEREDRVARQIVERFDAPGPRAMRSQEFLSGFGAGIDCRRTARDAATQGRTFVRRGRPPASAWSERFGALLVDFRPSEAEPLGTSICKDCNHAGPKYWKLGFARRATSQDGHRWPFAPYDALAVIFETTRTSGEVQALWYAEVASREDELRALVEAVLRHAPRGRPCVAVVSASRPSAALQRLARRHGRHLVWRSLESVEDLVRQIPGFHRLVATGHPDAE